MSTMNNITCTSVKLCKWILLLLSCVVAIPLNSNEKFETTSFNDINSNQSNDHLGSAINIHISEFDGERKVIIDSDDHVNHLLNTTMNKNNIPVSIVTFNKYQNIMNKSLFNLQFKIDKITSKIDTLELRLNKKLLINKHDFNDTLKNKNISINQVENINKKFTNDSSLRAKRKSENNNIKKYKKPHILSLYANFLPESFDNDRGNLLRRSKRTKRDLHEKINEWLIASPQLQQQFLRKWLDSKYYQNNNNNNEKNINYFYHLPSKTSSLTSASQYKKNFNIENDNIYESTSESSSSSSSSSFDMNFDHFYDSIADDTDESSELLTPVDNQMPTTTESIWDILWT